MFSSLATMQRISPYRNSPRNHIVDHIIPHCVVGQMAADSLGYHFQTAGCSANYAIGYDGTIIGIVPEEDRSWCTSSPTADNRGITIECASDAFHPYAVNDKVWNSLVALCVDICKRYPHMNGLRWKGDFKYFGQPKEQNIAVHRWFTAKSCPGDYIYSRLGKLADEVNAILKEDEEEMTYDSFKEMMQKYEAEKNAMNASDWAQKALDFVQDNGIMVGDNSGLHPRSDITRQEVAQVLYNLFNKYDITPKK